MDIVNSYESRILRGVRKALECVFLALSAVYLFYAFSLTTTIRFPFADDFEDTLKIAMTVAALVRLAFIGPLRPAPWIGVALAWLYGLSYLTGGYKYMPFLAILTVGLIGIDYRKILKVWLAVVGVILSVAVVAALTGSIHNYIFRREGDGLRSSWGSCYPTDLTTAVLFLMMILWAVWRKLPDWAALILCLVPLLLALFITRSRNGLICGSLFILAVGYHWFEQGRRRRRGRGGRLERGVNGLLIIAFPLCAVFSLFLVYLYSRDIAIGYKLNDLFSDRLRLSLENYRAHGISPFGCGELKLGGLGFSVVPPLEYNYLDCSYVLVLLRDGWVTLLAYCALWCWTVRRAIRCGDRRLALVMGIFAVHSIMEHHLPEIHYDVLLAMPLAAYAPVKKRETRAVKRQRLAALGVAFAAALASAWLLLPGVLSRMRTITYAMNWREGHEAALPALGIILGLLLAFAAAVVALYWIVRAVLSRRRRGLIALPVLAVCVAVGFGFNDAYHRALDEAIRESAALVDADAPALELLGDREIYVNELPEVYRARFGNVGRTVLCGEDLARKRCATVLMDAEKNYHLFFYNGFSFAQISDAHAIYTNDPQVVDTLAGAGYTVTNYYSRRIHMDMEAMAKRNKVTYDEGGVLLKGKKRTMKKGPYVTLYNGAYEAVFTLSLPEGAKRSEGVVCEVRVNFYRGKVEAASVPVTVDQFGADGIATVTVPFSVPEAYVTGFPVLAKKGRQVRVEDITYYQVPTAQ